MAKLSPQVFAARLRRVRRARKLTQAEVASRIGIAKQAYGRLERGLCLPRLETLLDFCEALEVSVAHLIGEPQRSTFPGADESGFPKAPAADDDRERLLSAFFSMSDEHQALVLQMAEALAATARRGLSPKGPAEPEAPPHAWPTKGTLLLLSGGNTPSHDPRRGAEARRGNRAEIEILPHDPSALRPRTELGLIRHNPAANTRIAEQEVWVWGAQQEDGRAIVQVRHAPPNTLVTLFVNRQPVEHTEVQPDGSCDLRVPPHAEKHATISVRLRRKRTTRNLKVHFPGVPQKP